MAFHKLHTALLLDGRSSSLSILCMKQQELVKNMIFNKRDKEKENCSTQLVGSSISEIEKRDFIRTDLSSPNLRSVQSVYKFVINLCFTFQVYKVF